jgi:hypothetical protein
MRTEKSLPLRESNPGHPSRSLDTTMIALSRLPNLKCFITITFVSINVADSSINDFQQPKSVARTSFGGEVKPSVPCRRFTACKRTLHSMSETLLQNFPDPVSHP